jgi:hypothetical protein
MRRGDMVKINWANHGGHATFCWDVHVNSAGEVDCFQFLSSNGSSKSGGPGVSVSVMSKNLSLFVEKDKAGVWKKKKSPLFSDDELYLRHGKWICLPRVKKSEIDLNSFKNPTPNSSHLVDSGSYSASSVTVVRFWGVAPPTRAQDNDKYEVNFPKARELAAEQPPASYATGEGTPVPVTFTNVPTQKVTDNEVKKDPEVIKKLPPHPDKQKKSESVSQQEFVEQALHELYIAKWIDVSPGTVDAIIDAQTKKSTWDFQEKFKVKPLDGKPGKITRRALQKILKLLHAGKANPNKPDTKPKVEHGYFLHNHATPEHSNTLVLRGSNLDKMEVCKVTLQDEETSTTTVIESKVTAGDFNEIQLAILESAFAGFRMGAKIVAKFDILGNSGDVSGDVKSPLYVRPPVKKNDGDWPWDEQLWTKKMLDIIAELRGTAKPTGVELQQREITQYGVKEVGEGETQVLDDDGNELGRTDLRSLYKADIEGTMRLNGRILNITQSGHVYDKIVEKVVNGKVLKKRKPNPEKFDPQKSRWHDVTARAPWGSGSRTPLIPFRTLACNGSKEKSLYYKKVYIEQLDGLTLPTGEIHNGICLVGDCGGMTPGHQFDFFVGREERHISLPSLGKSQGGAACHVAILDGECEAAKPTKKRH